MRTDANGARKLRLMILVVVGVLLLGFGAARRAQAQTFQVIHNFTGGADGANPLGRVIVDNGGHVYSTTAFGGVQDDGGFGVAFRMSPAGSGWTFAPIYTFQPTDDGAEPFNGVQFGPEGILYGSTSNSSSVFALRPSPSRPRSALAPWNIDFLSDFPFAVWPAGDLVFDDAGNIYGATWTGGNHGCFNNEGCGMVYELTPSAGSWVQTPLYIFQGGSDGSGPAGIVLDSAGELIGVTEEGGAHNGGTLFKLTRSGGTWTKSTIYDFDCSGNDGCGPAAGLISDAAGNFYGSTVDRGSGYSGVIFELSPSGGSWTYSVLAQIPLQYQFGPTEPLTMDAAGNLYGTIGSRNSPQPPGAVFKVTRGNQGWTFTSLHDFTGAGDGGSVASTVAIGADGKLYGTAYGGGQHGRGVVWEITP